MTEPAGTPGAPAFTPAHIAAILRPLFGEATYAHSEYGPMAPQGERAVIAVRTPANPGGAGDDLLHDPVWLTSVLTVPVAIVDSVTHRYGTNLRLEQRCDYCGGSVKC